MMELVANVFKQVSDGQIPETRESVSDCLVHIVAAAVGEYIDGSSPVGRELEHLAVALNNDADPTVRGMNLGTRMQIRMALSHLTRLKDSIHGQQQR